jgi:hypothetical protein
MLFSPDTSLEARRLLIEILRKKTPAEKLAMVDDLIETARRFAISGLRLRHPGASPEALEARYRRLVLGPDAGPVLEARRSRTRTAPLGTDARRAH